MKRTAVAVGVSLAIFLLLVSSVSATTWYTYREDVAISSGYCDINSVIKLDNVPTWGNVSGNISLPCNIDNLSAMNFSVYNVTGADCGSHNGGGQTYNLTVNGIDVNSTSWINSSNQINWTSLTHYTAQGGSVTVKYISWVFDCSFQGILNITIVATDATLSSTYLANNLTMKEKDLTTPTVGMSQPAAFWTVNDSINVTANPYLFDLTDLTLNITYPGHTVGTPTTTTATVTTLAVNGTATDRYVQYQKRGPFVYDVDEDIDGRSHEVTIKLSCQELLTNVVDWTVYIDEDKYDDAFDTLNYNTLDVELNGVDQDWDEGSVELEDFTVFASIAGNKWVFAWTTAIAPAPVRRAGIVDSFVDWMNGEVISGMPNWLLTLVVIALISGIAIVYFYTKK